MQPIQSRIWDGQQMLYLAGLPLTREPFLTIWLQEAIALINQVPPVEEENFQTAFSWRLMRTIGQTDREGTLLYENDLVEWDGRIYEIGWSSHRCGYALFQPLSLHHVPTFSLSALHARQLRVLGNRYEHPQLLRQRYYSHAA
ncbi:YopX family protein [Larkinella soli]|uniref:YopX family protein n=1 Tax=Larkinella soli TaxID=1770527 RepID=UPI000FFBB5D4|nr:YopX family protein [Larkinella soli]